eukprot:TRINITY_DN11436_c0_g1_i1.p1 TRINITY_DN11436_c0_g1~~TRINITY_DN11436_c0_g1_i1.p1  ORF type:complete len:338 (-),score=80.08 TRINITY_DN11436_c0_g1_i1:66-1079(-)
MLLSVAVPKGIQLATFIQELQTELYYARVTKYLFKTAVTVNVVSVSSSVDGGDQQVLLSIVASPSDPAERWALKAITSMRTAESQHFTTNKGNASTTTASSASPFVSRKRKLLINSHLTLMSAYQSTSILGAADETTTTATHNSTIGEAIHPGNAVLGGEGATFSEVEAIRKVCDGFLGDLQASFSTADDNKNTTTTRNEEVPPSSTFQDVSLYSVLIQGMPMSVLLETLLPIIEGSSGSNNNINNKAWTTLLGKEAGGRFISASIGFELEASKTVVASSQALSMGGVFALGQMLYGGCLLYTSDAADEEDSVDLGGCRIIKKKKKKVHRVRQVQID